ncbi:hypothetical protein HH308_11440 [Gordonia sp. TBRC 11910]|uniref:Uncharacterized protein n=1 Tax=Gordonia asplenii TaxID=2725283 RepID=A0A848KS87_9ACTN|nr:hypothetical protein [Gordonia asplenii]NMO01824.1 hypothetical protein [Gordonia asplenii]
MKFLGISRNLPGAVKAAQEIGIRAWALTGPAPNSLAGVVDGYVPVEGVGPTVHEVHRALIHALCTALDHRSGVE